MIPTHRLTKDDHSGSEAASLCHNVASQTCVVPRVGQTRLLDDQVVVRSRVDVPVRAHWLFILQPLHLEQQTLTGSEAAIGQNLKSTNQNEEWE